jgi:predicted 3-demethylubiquinone-9 3-methyltransferase (glyoxalase superfamily)
MSKITPFLWFNDTALEAMIFYTSVFNDSALDGQFHDGDTPMVVSGRIAGQQVVALNGGPAHQFTEAFSFTIDCRDQTEVDHYWDALTADGGEPSKCGWLKDRFGLSWQVVPRQFGELMQGPDPEASQRVFEAMLQMTKFDVAALQRAHDGEPA